MYSLILNNSGYEEVVWHISKDTQSVTFFVAELILMFPLWRVLFQLLESPDVIKLADFFCVEKVVMN